MKHKMSRLKKHILNNHLLHLVLGSIFGLALILRVLTSNAQQSNNPLFPFNTFIAQHSNTTNIHFKYGGNSFTGIIAWSGWNAITPEKVTLSGNTEIVYCSKQLEGMYYNALRGSKLWPLDQKTLDNLKSIDNSYNTMSIGGGIYTDCSGTNIQADMVIGQITHNNDGLYYYLYAGLKYNALENKLDIPQSISAGSLKYQNSKFDGKIFDMQGGGIADFSNQNLPGVIGLGGFSGAVFYPGINSVENAIPGDLYQSNTFRIAGLGEKTLVIISSGVLQLNGSGIGITGMIDSQDKLSIKLFASDQYDRTISSYLTVGSGTSLLTGVFSVTTRLQKPDTCNLTKEKKKEIQAVFSGLVEKYETTDKLITLMGTTQSMIDDMQDFNYDCNLAYLQDLVDIYIKEQSGDTATKHIAPNCKKYTIAYDETKKGYTSSNFKVKQYFATRQSLIKFIDSKNPGDCSIAVYSKDSEEYKDLGENMYVAPNGKVYEIVESGGKFTTPNSINKKEFSSKDALISYIDKNNFAIEVWDHEVDTDTNPIIYVATNSKEYKIYNTDKGYMSYKLVKVKYFDTQEDIIAYIEINNKK